jgi:hypothetical protein
MEQEKKSFITISFLKALKCQGYSSSDILIIIAALSCLDSANCLAKTESELASLVLVSERSVTRTFSKLKQNLVFKNGLRHDFSKFLESFSEKQLDNT